MREFYPRFMIIATDNCGLFYVNRPHQRQECALSLESLANERLANRRWPSDFALFPQFFMRL